MALTPGTRIGSYEIAEQIGVGGMGEVYRATDKKLKRHVAVKVLPEALAADAERLARFQREAEVLASLNHPGIAHIYGIEDADGSKALVMELVEGPTLADRIVQGPIPVDEALPIAKQIAEALEAAHEQGIVHRDLKPANIKLRPDGTVKVLDFGLAKAMGPTAVMSSSLSMSPTITTPAMTQAGLILGTAAYMSPEQARGKQADKRADIWSFGCVLYEMLSGRRAFEAEDVSLTLAEVMKSEPDLGVMPAKMPSRVRQALHLCLQKDVRQRGGDIAAIRLVLDGAFEPIAPPPGDVAVSARSRWMRGAPWAAIVALAAALAVVMLRPGPAPEVMRFQIHAPPGSTLPLGTPAVSPDGRMFAYAVNDPDGFQRIHVRAIDEVNSRALPGTEGGVHPFWSPDGRAVAFVSLPSFELKHADLAGGAPRLLAAGVAGPWHGSWSTRDALLFVGAEGLGLVPAEGGEPMPVPLENDLVGRFPFFLADGERFLTLGDGEIRLARLGSTESSLVLPNVESAPILAQIPDGRSYLLYQRPPDLIVQEFDEATRSVRGTPRVLVSGIGQVASPALLPSVGTSASGVLAYQVGGVGEFLGRLALVNRQGEVLDRLPSSIVYAGPRLSPDGESIAGRQLGERGNGSIWITDLGRAGIETRVTFTEGGAEAPTWSPDGERLAFSTGGQLFLVNVNGGEPEPLEAEIAGVATSWSSDGERLLIDQAGDSLETVVMVSLVGAQEPVALGLANGNSQDGQFSPEGTLMAFVSDQTGREEVYLRPVPPAAGSTIQVSVNGGSRPRWRGDGRELYFLSPETDVMVATVEPGDARSAGVPTALFRAPGLSATLGYDVDERGERFLLAGAGTEQADVPITVVMNWWTELE